MVGSTDKNYCTIFIALISLNNSNSGATNKTINFGYNHTQANVVIGEWNSRKGMVEKQFQTNMFFSIFTKGVYGFRRFNLDRVLIPNCWRSHI